MHPCEHYRNTNADHRWPDFNWRRPKTRVRHFWPSWVQRWRWWPLTRADGAGSSSQSRESFNDRSTVNWLPRWLWLVGKYRGNRGKQNPSDNITGNRRNRGEMKRQFRDFSRLQSAAFRTLFGHKIGMEMIGIARSSDRYQPWPGKWPEMEIASGSGLWVRHAHFDSQREYCDISAI